MKRFNADVSSVSGKGTQRFLPIALDSGLAREGAVRALRMIEGLRWHQRLLNRNGVRDRDILTLLGLEQDDDRDGSPTIAEFRDAVQRQRRRLEPKLRIGNDLLARNVGNLGDVLKLNSTERSIVRLGVVATTCKYFGDLFCQTIVTERDFIRAIQIATGCRLSDVRSALSGERTLRRSGFLGTHQFRSGIHNPLEMDDDLAAALLSHRFDETRLLRRLVRAAPAPTLTLADFEHLPDLDLIQRYIHDTLARRRKGANILLFGAPGTGKTEFVRALAPALNVALHEVPNEDANGDPISGHERFSAYTVCQRVLAHRRREVLLFDEIEDVFGASGESLGSLFAMFGGRAGDPDRLRKSWVNETLESNPVPAVWVCNSIGSIDPAFLRRFDLVVEFRAPGRAVRRRLIDRYFRPGEISAACADRLADVEHLPPAQVERAARVVRSLRTRDVAKRDVEIERVVTASLRAMGHNQPIPAPILPAHYDPTFLNTDHSLEAITRGLQRGGGARLCLYGAPGTGKTAFAHHLGRELAKPVLVKRASDLLNMYVGQTEAKIRKAFRQACTDDAILVIDEADSFLRERSGAQHGWEVTQVNELLTQMEAFDGIFVASTNLIDMLDAASLRRFDFKVKFDYLTREQRCAMLLRVATDADNASDELRTALASLERLDQLTPGDFANVLRQLRMTGEVATATHIVHLLADEVAIKPEGRRQKMGFVS